MKNTIVAKYGFDKNGVNLSGLPEKPPEVDALVLEMAEKADAISIKRKRDAVISKNTKKVSNGIEGEMLKTQGSKLTSSTIDLSAASPDDLVNKTTSSISTNDSNSLSKYLDGVSQSIQAAIGGDPEELKFDKELKIAQKQLAEKQLAQLETDAAETKLDREIARELQREQIAAARAQRQYYESQSKLN